MQNGHLLSHIRTAPSPLPLTRAYPQNWTPPTKSWYISQLPSALGGLGTAKELLAALNSDAPGNPPIPNVPPLDWRGFAGGGCEIAHKISIVITHCPVLISHCRRVLSEAPLTRHDSSKYTDETPFVCPSNVRKQPRGTDDVEGRSTKTAAS